MAQAMATALELQDDPVHSPLELVGAALAGRGATLFLDNVEQVVGAVGAINSLLSAAPDLRIVATSRVPLHVSGEAEFAVRPLALPTADVPASVEASPAGALFLARAREIGQLHALDDEAARLVARVCRDLDGLPLAIELAAARTRVIPLTSIVAHLEARDPHLLERSWGPERHRSLRAVLDWTIELLTGPERGLLLATSVCVGGFDLEMASVLAPNLDSVLGALDSLVTYGLIETKGDVAGRARFRMLEPIRLEARRRLGDGAADVERLFAAQVAAVVASAIPALHTRDGASALMRIDADVGNLDAALAWAQDADPDLALRISSQVAEYWVIRGRLREGVAQIDLALLGTPHRSSVSTARALGGLLNLKGSLSGPIAVRAESEFAANVGRDTADYETEAMGLMGIAVAELEAGARASAQAVAWIRKRARELTSIDVSPTARFFARIVRSVAAEIEHGADSDAALEELDLAIAEESELADRIGLAIDLGNRASAYVARADYLQASVDGKVAASLSREFRYNTRETIALLMAAIGLAGIGRADEARELLKRVAELTALTASPYELSQALFGSSGVAALLGDSRTAAVLAGAAQGLSGSTQSTPIPEVIAIVDRARRDGGELQWRTASEEGHRNNDPRALLAWFAYEWTPPRAGRPVHARHADLTAREIEVLTLVAEGKSDAQIASTLSISPKTASVHVSNAKAKLGVDSRLEAALVAGRLGLSSADASKIEGHNS